jgi:argininosuccinate lyase
LDSLNDPIWNRNFGILLPGYTHLQRAQPVLWSHWILHHAEFFRSDLKYLDFVRTQTAVCPLGSGALAGNPFAIDRKWISDQLGFDRPSDNSMTAVSDRDFISHFLHFCTMFLTHCSRLAEDIILYSSKEFGFMVVADEYCTGSSLMPQKKNADSLELIRGKFGRALGNVNFTFLINCWCNDL